MYKDAPCSSHVAPSGTNSLQVKHRETKEKWGEKGQNGDTDMVLPDTTVFPTVADTAGHLLSSILPF